MTNGLDYTTTCTFADLESAEAALAANDPRRDGINRLLAHAEDNGGRVDGEMMRSLEGLLCDEGAEAGDTVCAWFYTHGVRW